MSMWTWLSVYFYRLELECNNTVIQNDINNHLIDLFITINRGIFFQYVSLNSSSYKQHLFSLNKDEYRWWGSKNILSKTSSWCLHCRVKIGTTIHCPFFPSPPLVYLIFPNNRDWILVVCFSKLGATKTCDESWSSTSSF